MIVHYNHHVKPKPVGVKVPKKIAKHISVLADELRRVKGK